MESKKTYFAKYLPVREESTSNTWQWNNNPPQFRKVQLFLCSTDIQVGDTATNNYGAKIPWTENAEELFKTEALLKDGLFKVIGPISPQALWVKEGDEFEEQDIEFVFRYIGDDGRDFEDIVNPLIFAAKQVGWGHNCGSIREKVVRVKCSNCETFH